MGVVVGMSLWRVSAQREVKVRKRLTRRFAREESERTTTLNIISDSSMRTTIQRGRSKRVSKQQTTEKNEKP